MIFKQIFRVAFVALIWKQYKGLIISSTILIVYLLLISNVHDDYLTHSQLLGDSSRTGLSFIYKWAAYGLGILVYFGFHALRPPRISKKELQDQANQANQAAKHNNDDPFAKIREMDKLRSRADFIEQEKR